MKQKLWINLAKFAAIIAVLVDHTSHVLYKNINIKLLSFFSVSLFLFIVGVTTYVSFVTNISVISQKIIKRILSLFISYAFATLIYYLTHFKNFDFVKYVNYFFHFNISTPFYYVLLYLQVLIVSPILFYFVAFGATKMPNSIKRILYFIGGGVLILLLSSFANRYSTVIVPWVKICGGSYLFLVYCGMIFEASISNNRQNDNKYKKYYALLFFILLLVWQKYMCASVIIISGRISGFVLDKIFPFGDGTNPPSFVLTIYSLLIVCFIFCIGEILEKTKYEILGKIAKACGWLGTHTLYIFLYHKLFLDYVLRHFSIQNIWCKRVAYFAVMIFGSVAIEYFCKVCIVAKKFYVREVNS